jgi:D-alanyl-D-alanine carboxypeptidase
VVGSRGYFAHDWFAPGWKPSFPSSEVALPSALSLDGNTAGRRHVRNPERRFAAALTRRLRRLGVEVMGGWRAGSVPRRVRGHVLAEVRSAPLPRLLRYMCGHSSNFFAEVLGKRLAVVRFGRRGSIARGAAAIVEWPVIGQPHLRPGDGQVAAGGRP